MIIFLPITNLLLILALASLLFLLKVHQKICDRLLPMKQEKRSGNDTCRFDDEIVTMIDKLLEYKCLTPNEHEQNYVYLFYYKCLGYQVDLL